jgi:hypothetical protein
MQLRLMELLDKCGPVIYIGPNELSHGVLEAWEDIFGHYRSGHRREDPGSRLELRCRSYYMQKSVFLCDGNLGGITSSSA